MRGLGTDHVISGPMRGLKNTASNGADRQTSGHRNSMTESTQWGRFCENQIAPILSPNLQCTPLSANLSLSSLSWLACNLTARGQFHLAADGAKFSQLFSCADPKWPPVDRICWKLGIIFAVKLSLNYKVLHNRAPPVFSHRKSTSEKRVVQQS